MSKKNFVNKIIICSVIFLCTFGANAASLPPDPNNAALLYYRAFLVLPEPDYSISQLILPINTTEKIYEYLKGAKLDPDPEEKIKEIEKSIRDLELKKGISPDSNEQLSPREKAFSIEEYYNIPRIDDLYLLKEELKHHKKMRIINPNKVIREYLNECGQSIALAKAASEIQKCDWGRQIVKENSSFSSQLLKETRRLGIILRTDALRLAVDGNYRAALENCLMILRLTHNLGTPRYFHGSTAIDAIALKHIQFILGCMKSDIDTLTWLKKQIAIDPLVSESLPAFIKQNFEHYIWAINIQGKYLPILRQQLADKAANDRLKKQTLDLTNEEILRLIREPYAEFVDSVLDILASDMLYKQKYRRIEKLGSELNEKAKGNPAINLYVRVEATDILSWYGTYVVHKAHINALKNAVEIYLIKSRTGQLPEKLPDGLPKDPFSGEAFEYKITDEGFALRCKGRDINASPKKYSPDKPPIIVSDYFWKYEFKVKK